MTTVAAVDLGAESGRVMGVDLADDRIEVTELHRFETPTTKDALGRRCWNFGEIMTSVKTGLKELSSKSGDVASIGVDTWGLDFGVINKQSELISDPVSYRDPRTKNMVEECSAVVGRERLYGDTGIQLLECNSIFQLRAMVLQTPQEFAEIDRMLMTPDLVQHELCGSVDSEYTIASTSGLLDIRTGEWATTLASDLGIPTSLLPPVIQPGTVRGPLLPEVAKEVGMANALCIASASHDTAAAVVATPFVAPGAGFISSGTWSLVGVEIDSPVINEITRDGDLTNEGGYGNKVRLLRNVMGLWLLQECRRDWQQRGEVYGYAELVDAASSAEPWRTFIHTDDPDFIPAGEMIARIQDFAKRTRQPVPETVGQIARCVLESLALQYANTFDLLERCSGLPMPAVHIVGGGSKNELLCQLTADVSGREVIAGPVEATTMGNAIVQWISMGKITDVAQARDLVKQSSNFKRYQPSGDGRVQSVRQRYNQIVEQSKKVRAH